MNKNRGILFISAMMLASPLFSIGQDTPGLVGTDKKMQLHHETVDDRYLPNAYNGKKFSPGYKYNSTVALKLMNSSISTIQVNVDAGGQNIPGDAANEPNIAVNPLNENEMVIGWRQFDNVISNFRQAGWSYTSDGAQSWTFLGVLEPGVFRSDPVLDYDSNGTFYYNSLSGTLACKIFKSSDGGASWDNGTDAGGGDKQCMTIDRTTGVGNGNIYSSWTFAYTTCPPGFFTRSTDEGNSYEDCTEVDGSPFWGTMAIGKDGELYVCGMDTFGNMLVTKSLTAQIPGSLVTWSPAVPVFMGGSLGFGTGTGVNPAGLLGQAYIDIDRSSGSGQGNVYLLASIVPSSFYDPADVMFAKSTDGGNTWSSPIRINDDSSVTNTQWFGTMSVAPNGRIDAVWLDTRDDLSGSDSSALYYSYSTDQGNTWSVNEKLSSSFDPHTGYPNQDKMGDYFDMVSDNSGAHLAWANTLNGEEDVYYSHIIPQVLIGANEIPDNKVSIFPNPSSGAFIITSEAKQSYLEIYTIPGQKLYSKTILETRSEVDISSQPAGIYFLKIVNQDGNAVVKKLIIQ